MNLVLWFFAVAHRHLLESLLVASIAALAAQILLPSLIFWWHSPSPADVGVNEFRVPSLASQHLVYMPESYDGSPDWPLVVFLHGSGERGIDLSQLRTAKLLHLRLPTIVVVPQCLPNNSWQPAAVAALVRHLSERYRVDRRRVYLVGYSMGGFGIVATAAAYPEEFAAVVPIAGGMRSADAAKLHNIPMWAFHGANDETVPVAESERLVDAVKKAGGDPKLTVLPNAGHGICDEVCRRDDLWQWLFAQRRTD